MDKSLTGSGTQPVTADDFYLLMRNVLEAPTRTIDTMILEKSRTKSSSHGVVESICTAVDHQDNTAYQITLCAGNQYKKFYVPPDSQIISKVVDADGKYVLECGDFIRYTADQRDELTDISLDFDLSKEDVLRAVTRENHELNYYYGKVNAVSGNTVSLQLWDSSNTNAKGGGEHAVTLLNKRAYVWLVDTKRKKVTAVSLDPKDFTVTNAAFDGDLRGVAGNKALLFSGGTGKNMATLQITPTNKTQTQILNFSFYALGAYSLDVVVDANETNKTNDERLILHNMQPGTWHDVGTALCRLLPRRALC